MAEEVLAKDRFATLDSDRGSTLDRAVLCSELTVPYIFMEDGSSAQDDLSREYVQGFGAKLVNNLVGKFALTILPPAQPFYRFSPTEEALTQVANGNEQAINEIEKILSTKEEAVLRYINKSNFRKSLYPALRLSVVTGDSLIEMQDDDTFRVFNMRNYVIKRDSSGNIIDLVIKEMINKNAVPDDITVSDNTDEEIELYTRMELVDGTFNFYQEIDGNKINETTYKDFNEKFISLPFSLVLGEDYGRSYVEEHLGTFISLNKNLKVIVESGIVNAKTIFTLNPNGMTKYKDFVNAKNGDAIIGNETDIGIVRTNKFNDLQITYSMVQDYKKELSEAFLMGSSAVRDAERVTAREIQLIANELETSFGGIYTYISSSVQLPLINLALSKLKINLTKDVEVIVTAGVEALGRNVEITKLNNMIQELVILSNLVGSETVAKHINTGSIVAGIVANSGVASKNYLYTQSEVDAITKQQKEDAIAQQVMQGGLPQAGQNLANAGIPIQ